MTPGLLVVAGDPSVCPCGSAWPCERTLAEIKRLAGNVPDAAIVSASLKQERMGKE